MPEKGKIPLSRIEDMQLKGLTNNQIIQTLQRDGYSATEVFDALNQANFQPTHQETINMDQPMMPPPPGPSYSDPVSSGASDEELIEAIIDEKWNELSTVVNKIVDWKEFMEGRIQKLEQRMDDLKHDYDKLHEAVVGKIGEYDKNILEVGAEVKAMEKVFSKVLPVFTDNVAQLNRITEKMREGKR